MVTCGRRDIAGAIAPATAGFAAESALMRRSERDRELRDLDLLRHDADLHAEIGELLQLLLLRRVHVLGPHVANPVSALLFFCATRPKSRGAIGSDSSKLRAVMPHSPASMMAMHGPPPCGP